MMKIVQSTVEPKPLVIDDYSAWIAENVQEVTNIDEEGKEHIEYEYQLTQLTKDEYILKLHDDLQQSKLESDLAITDLAETFLGGGF